MEGFLRGMCSMQRDIQGRFVCSMKGVQERALLCLIPLRTFANGKETKGRGFLLVTLVQIMG